MPIDEMSKEIDDLLEYLGVPNEKPKTQSIPTPTEKPSVTPVSKPTSNLVPEKPKANGEFVRVKKTPSVEVQQIAQKILHQMKGQSYGTKMPFTHDGKEYMAVLEEHIGGRVPGPHPGISLFEKSASYENIFNLSKNFCKLIKS